MGLDLKFRPTLKPSTVLQFTEQIKDFTRNVCLYHRFVNTPEDPNINPKLYLKSHWNPLHEDFQLKDNLYLLKKELQQKYLHGRHTQL